MGGALSAKSGRRGRPDAAGVRSEAYHGTDPGRPDNQARTITTAHRPLTPHAPR